MFVHQFLLNFLCPEGVKIFLHQVLPYPALVEGEHKKIDLGSWGIRREECLQRIIVANTPFLLNIWFILSQY